MHTKIGNHEKHFESIFFEYISLKGFSRQIIRIFDFFNLASDSRHFQSWALKYLKNVRIIEKKGGPVSGPFSLFNDKWNTRPEVM